MSGQASGTLSTRLDLPDVVDDAHAPNVAVVGPRAHITTVGEERVGETPGVESYAAWVGREGRVRGNIGADEIGYDAEMGLVLALSRRRRLRG